MTISLPALQVIILACQVNTSTQYGYDRVAKRNAECRHAVMDCVINSPKSYDISVASCIYMRDETLIK